MSLKSFNRKTSYKLILTKCKWAKWHSMSPSTTATTSEYFLKNTTYSLKAKGIVIILGFSIGWIHMALLAPVCSPTMLLCCWRTEQWVCQRQRRCCYPAEKQWIRAALHVVGLSGCVLRALESNSLNWNTRLTVVWHWTDHLTSLRVDKNAYLWDNRN